MNYYLKKLNNIVKTTLITINDIIGKNNVEFSDLNTKSPGNCPKPIFLM